MKPINSIHAVGLKGKKNQALLYQVQWVQLQEFKNARVLFQMTREQGHCFPH